MKCFNIIHKALYSLCFHSYLIDQFLRDSVNQRDDNYGGSLENRCKFPLQVLDTLISVFGSGRVGIKLSPFSRYQDISDSDPKALYTYFIEQLNVRNLAFLEMVEKGEMEFKTNVYHPKPEEQMKEKCLEFFRPIFKGMLFFLFFSFFFLLLLTSLLFFSFPF